MNLEEITPLLFWIEQLCIRSWILIRAGLFCENIYLNPLRFFLAREAEKKKKSWAILQNFNSFMMKWTKTPILLNCQMFLCIYNCSAFYCASFSGQRKSESIERINFAEKSSLGRYLGKYLWTHSLTVLYKLSCQAYIRLSSGSCQTVVRQLAGSCQAVVEQLSGNRLAYIMAIRVVEFSNGGIQN